MKMKQELERMLKPGIQSRSNRCSTEKDEMYALCECSLVYARLMCVITRNERDEWWGKAPHKAFILWMHARKCEVKRRKANTKIIMVKTNVKRAFWNVRGKTRWGNQNVGVLQLVRLKYKWLVNQKSFKTF